MVSVDLEIPARSPYVGVVRLALSSLARTAGLDEEALDDLKIAVSEACANAVLASEEAGSDAAITIRWSEEPDRLIVDISDPMSSADDQGELAADTGGFSSRLAMSGALLETLVDDCEIRPLPEGGIQTRLVVNRPGE